MGYGAGQGTNGYWVQFSGNNRGQDYWSSPSREEGIYWWPEDPLPRDYSFFYLTAVLVVTGLALWAVWVDGGASQRTARSSTSNE